MAFGFWLLAFGFGLALAFGSQIIRKRLPHHGVKEHPTAKRLHPPAHGCRLGYPGYGRTQPPNRNAVAPSAQGCRLGYPGYGRTKPSNREAVASFPDVTLVPFNLVLLQQQSQFILKINFLMMLSLVGDLILHFLRSDWLTEKAA